METVFNEFSLFSSNIVRLINKIGVVTSTTPYSTIAHDYFKYIGSHQYVQSVNKAVTILPNCRISVK